MKKLNKLFAILIAVLGVQTLSAQTSWQTPTNNQTYYLYNVDKGVFMNRGNDWGSQASGLETGEAIKLVASGAQYKLRSNNGNQGVFWEADNVWMDGSGSTDADRIYEWNLNKLSDGFYTLVPNGKSQSQALGVWADTPENTRLNTRFSATGTRHDDAPVRWAFITAAQYNAAKSNVAASISERASLRPYILSARSMGFTSEETNAFYDINSTKATLQAALNTLPAKLLNYAKENGSEAKPMDISFLVKNAYCISLDNWTSVGDTWATNSWNFQENGDACGWGIYLERWVGSDGSLADSELYQTLTGLPVGEYTLQVDACAALQNGNKSEVTGVQLYAEAYQPSSTTISTPEEKPETWTTSFVTIDGQAKVGFKRKSTTANWLMFDNFKLYYKGVTVEVLKISLAEAITKAKAIDQSTLSAGLKNLLNTTIAEGESAKSSSDKAVVEVATNDLISAMNAVVEVPAAMTELETCIEDCENIYENSTAKAEIRNAFETAINNAKAIIPSATAVATVTNAIATLQDARYIYIHKACPTNGLIFDVSDVMTTAWANGGGNYTAAGVTMKERYSAKPYTGEVMSTVITDLTNGIYDVEIYCNANAAMHDAQWEFTDGAELTSVHANDISTKIPVMITKGNDYANVITLNDITVKDHTLTIKIVNDELAANWVVVAHKSLIIKSGLDVSEQQSAVSALIVQANGIKDEIMGNTEKVALNAAIDEADATSDNPDDLEAMITELQEAVDAAKISIDTYSKVPAYIAKAKAIGVALADDYQTQYDNRTLMGDAVTIFQNLEVATYNYVMSNFTYPVALSDTWNSTGTNTQAATFSNEHWSGETREYKNQDDSNGQGWAASSWTIDFDQEVTLPAGEYVFKVAGRKSEGTTLELVVTMGATVLGTVNDFPATNHALGINKTGATSFDPEDEAGFARNGEGFGWQWRYVRFVLNSESTVKVAVHAEANEVHQWVSFGDYTLQMTEDTYLEANKDGLDAPTAVAQALVNAVPMGSEEIEALQQALDMTYTTGAGLLAKIEALNAAIANAEAWVPKYNEAKAPLVAALERFEADYNDAQNGSLDYMNKSHWATAISMAQAAAEAKDVTDSYAGFAEATENLVAALDAATISVEEYAALNAAIKTAKPLYEGGNWGDQPFQRPVSVKESLNTASAQATYDAATADGEDVISLTNELNEAIDKTNNAALNAPAEGTRYNMVIDYEGWEHHGKAVTFLAGSRTDAGFYNIQYYAAPNVNYAQAFTFTAVESQTDCYTLSMTDIDGNERYVCTGTVYGGNAGQLRTTTDAAQALAVKVIATTTDGIHQLWNTEANDYIGGQDTGFFTVNSHTTFRLQEAKKANITLTIPEEGWTTLILPFDAELPENVKAYSCSEVENEVLTLVEAESLKANTPYLVNGYENDYYFSGYGLADKDSYTDGLFTGTYVEYQTTANNNTYVLQNVNSELGFYLVDENEQPAVDAYCCYITYEAQEGEEQASKFLLSGGQEDDPTAIEDTEHKAQDAVLVYDLMGRKVTTMEKGKFYIVNGIKVIIK